MGNPDQTQTTYPGPFDGAISRFFEETAPDDVRNAIKTADEKDIIGPTYPYKRRMKKKTYKAEYDALQREMVRLQSDAIATGKRIVVVFEGRDAAGKGGAISAFADNLNPRTAKIVALPKPSEREAGSWYFQRYIEHLPARGEIALFDRSWYNRGVVEHVFGFCTPDQRAAFFEQLHGFENLLVQDGIHVVKIWLNVGRAEQLRRLLARESDPLKQWKLSRIDVGGLEKWDAYSDAIAETLTKSDHPVTPWTVIRADDKYRARLAAMRAVLSGLDYAGKDESVACAPDPKIAGGIDIWA